MATHQESIRIHTTGHSHMQNLTDEVAQIVSRSAISLGTTHVFNIGYTGVVGTIEFEPGLESDFPQILDELVPPSREYGHELAWNDGNGHSHLQASWNRAGPYCASQAKPAGARHLAADISSRV